jgi:hypothetical protein
MVCLEQTHLCNLDGCTSTSKPRPPLLDPMKVVELPGKTHRCPTSTRSEHMSTRCSSLTRRTKRISSRYFCDKQEDRSSATSSRRDTGRKEYAVSSYLRRICRSTIKAFVVSICFLMPSTRLPIADFQYSRHYHEPSWFPESNVCPRHLTLPHCSIY